MDSLDEWNLDDIIQPEGEYTLCKGCIYKALYEHYSCLLYTSPSPRDKRQSRMPSSA